MTDCTPPGDWTLEDKERYWEMVPLPSEHALSRGLTAMDGMRAMEAD